MGDKEDMKCEFDYCIYNKKLICILEEIQMNSIGMCDNCITVAISEDKLETYKKNQLQEMLKRITIN